MNTMKHSKQKGNLAVSATIKALHKLDINVFIELGDLSKIDLIAEFERKLFKIQVKYADIGKRGEITLSLRKSGPNGYRYTYQSDDVDIFAIYVKSLDKVLFIPSKIACGNKSSFVIRSTQSKNNQQVGVHLITMFEDLVGILRDYTPTTCDG